MSPTRDPLNQKEDAPGPDVDGTPRTAAKRRKQGTGRCAEEDTRYLLVTTQQVSLEVPTRNKERDRTG